MFCNRNRTPKVQHKVQKHDFDVGFLLCWIWFTFWIAVNCILWKNKLFMMQIKCQRQNTSYNLYAYIHVKPIENDVTADERWNVLCINTFVQFNQVDRHFKCFANVMSTNYRINIYIFAIKYFIYWFWIEKAVNHFWCCTSAE